MRKTLMHLGLTGALLLGGGCATTSKKDMTVDTNEKVNQLVNQLSPAVDNLNKTTTELDAKVETNDQNTRKLQSHLEEMQAQMDRMDKTVKSVQKVVYQSNNMTLPGSGPSVTIEPRADAPAGDVAAIGSAPAPATAPAPAAEPAAIEPISAPVPKPEAAAPAPPADGGNPKELYQQAQQRYASDDFQSAIKLFDDFLAKYPGDESAANAQFWKAKSQLRMGQMEDSIGEFLKVQKNYPNSTKVPFSLHNAAVANNKLGRNDEAARLLKQVIEKYPISPAADQARQDLKKIQGQ